MVTGCHAPLDASRSATRRVPRFRGPIPTRNQHPIALTYAAFRPRRAATQARGSWSFAVDSAYSSIFQYELSGPEAVLLDGELWTAGVRARYGLDDRSDLEIELPFVATSGGFLDGFVGQWHDFFGFPNGNRESRPPDAFAMQVSYAGAPVYSLAENHVGPGDASIVWTRAVRTEDDRGPGVALRASVQLPTGSTSDGTSNGELDWGIGLIAERGWERVDLTGGIDFVHAPAPNGRAGAEVDDNDLWGAQLGAEYVWNERLSLLVQLVYTSPLLAHFTVEELGSEIVDIGIGAAFDTGSRSRLLATFHEDLLSKAGTDFALAVSWIWGS